MDMGMQHSHGLAVWTWACIIDKYMLFVHVHVHAEYPCPFCMTQYMLHVQVDAAYLSTCCMSMSMLHVYVMLHVHVFVAVPMSRLSMDKDM
jgi:hypothetical protein